MKTAEEVWNDNAGRHMWACMFEKEEFMEIINNERREQHEKTLQDANKGMVAANNQGAIAILSTITFESTQEDK